MALQFKNELVNWTSLFSRFYRNDSGLLGHTMCMHQPPTPHLPAPSSPESLRCCIGLICFALQGKPPTTSLTGIFVLTTSCYGDGSWILRRWLRLGSGDREQIARQGFGAATTPPLLFNEMKRGHVFLRKSCSRRGCYGTVLWSGLWSQLINILSM